MKSSGTGSIDVVQTVHFAGWGTVCMAATFCERQQGRMHLGENGLHWAPSSVPNHIPSGL